MEYLPGKQLVHAEVVPGGKEPKEDVPALQPWQPNADPSTEYWPIRQLVHEEEVPPPVVELVPAAQGIQPDIEPAVE